MRFDLLKGKQATWPLTEALRHDRALLDPEDRRDPPPSRRREHETVNER
jgi:hypothetical protein